MSWAVIADSSCNLRGYEPEAPDVAYHVAPLKINVGGVEYVDDEELDVAGLNRAIAAESSATSSACPSAGEWAELFRCADNIIAITISANLSASYEAACMARDMVLDEEPHNIHIVNSRAAGGKLELLATEVDRYLIGNPNATFEEVCDRIDDLERRSTVLFSLSSYENLTKSGRMPKMAGRIASTFNIRILGAASDEGTIEVVAPTRGLKKMLAKVVDNMGTSGFQGGTVFIDHVDNDEAAEGLRASILKRWPDSDVRIVPCGGLCSYYAEKGGLIIGFSW